MSDRTDHARALFAPLGPTYDRFGATLSFGQDPRWRRFLVSRLPTDGGHVLDVAAGTGLVSQRLLQRGFRVTSLDQSTEMLAIARRRLGERATFVDASAEAIPFPDATFDHLTVTYLLRYVDDPRSTLAELARVVKPGGTIALLEFGLPTGIWRPLWELHVRVGLPVAGRVVSPGWHAVGRFLGGSIKRLWRELPEEALVAAWHDAGISEVRVRHLSLGGGVVVSGIRRGAEPGPAGFPRTDDGGSGPE
jgi:demethylmenaquinone methyltransferase / 2-methoxy-6-polyprenyl-1,4-benzoquinol methylase